MNIDRNPVKALLLICLCLLAPVCLAQEGKQDGSPESEPGSGGENPAGDSHETDVSEDNYRRYMELRDQQGERDLPVAAFVRPASLEKMQSLPEASQKHLRNELRDAIVQNGPWSPDQHNAIYPHAPSEAALQNPELKVREAEAWEELVAQYHEREADIYASSSRAQAASRTGDPGDRGTGEGSSGQTGVSGRDAPDQGHDGGGQTRQDSVTPGAIAASSSSAGASADADQVATKGVAQNALAYLQSVPGRQANADTPESASESDSPPVGTPVQAESLADSSADPSGQASRPQTRAQADESAETGYLSPGTLKIEDLGKAQGIISHQPASGRHLNGAELQALLVGNTVTGSYPDPDDEHGSSIRFYEYADLDGTLVFSDERYGVSTGTWRIRDDGCNDTDYDDSDEYDGCYYYQDNGDGTFTIQRPGSDVPGIQRVLPGNPQNLKKPE